MIEINYTFKLFLIIIIIILLIVKCKRSKIDGLKYECFVLTLKNSKRIDNFLYNFNTSVPLNIIYGPDTRTPEKAKVYSNLIDKEKFNLAIKMYEDENTIRPNHTYFNLGAVGCFFGHLELYRRAFEKNIDYAVIFEDNCIVTDDNLYLEINDTIKDLGNDFEICYFHTWAHIDGGKHERSDYKSLKFLMGTKCYLINVKNMQKYFKYFLPMDTHIDLQHEDIIEKGARVYYRSMNEYLSIDYQHKSFIDHRSVKNHIFSRKYPTYKLIF